MSGRAQNGRGAGPTASEDPRTQRYRQAEKTMWDHYGLQPTERFVNVASPACRLRVVEVGSGEPILFVSGTAGTGPYWAPLVRELTGFRCLLLDRPGFGLSSPIDFSTGEYRSLTADVVRGVLDGLDIDRAHVVGASIGDLWALRFAQAEPSRVDRIALMGGGPLVPEIPVPKIIRVIASPLGAIMVRLPEKPGRAKAIMRGNGHRPSLEAGRLDEFIAWHGAFNNNTDSMKHERAMVRSIVNWRRGEFRSGLVLDDAELGGIKQPTLFVYGTADPIGSVEVWKRLIGVLPHAELHLVDGAGHVPWLDDPAAVGSRVSSFLGDSS